MHEFALRTVPVDLIEIPHYAETQKKLVKMYLEHFDKRLFLSPLAVSFRQGTYRIIQNPYILEALRKKGIKKIPCLVFLHLTEKEEESIYLHSSPAGMPLTKRETNQIKKTNPL